MQDAGCGGPYALVDERAQQARRDLLSEPHIAPLERLVNDIRTEHGQPEDVPSIDPCDGGTTAELLLLLEAPGPKALETGFVAINNPDKTAANLYHLLEGAGIERHRVIMWNIVPWYLGAQDKKKIRSATDRDIISAAPYLARLIRLLPNLKACVLFGRKAQLAEPMIRTMINVPIHHSPHPSPVAFNRSPKYREEALTALRQAASSRLTATSGPVSPPMWEARRTNVLEHILDLTGIYTPASSCSVATIGPIPSTLLERMQTAEYDQVPVINGESSPIGVITRSELEKRAEETGTLFENDPAIQATRISNPVHLGALLEAFSKRRAALVFDRQRWLGLMTLADLNRHALRGLLYLTLANFEERLANLIQSTYEDPWSWLDHVSEWDRVELVGNWEITKRKAVNLGPTHAASITQLLKVVEKDPVLYGLCGFQSRTKTEDALGAVPDVRNAVMHPVRPLATSTEDVLRLRRALGAMEDVLAHLDAQQIGPQVSSR